MKNIIQNKMKTPLLVYFKIIFEGYGSGDLKRPELRTNYYT